MYVGFPSSSSLTYASLRAGAVTSEVTLTGDGESAVPAKAPKANVGGALNSLDRSASMNVRPLLTRGALQRLTGLKVRGLDLDSLEVSRSSLSLDSAGVTVEEGEGTTCELAHLEARNVSFDLQGTVQTKSGDDVGLEVQLSATTVSGFYASLTSETDAASEGAVPNGTSQIDTAA